MDRRSSWGGLLQRWEDWVGIELERVLARLAESDGREAVVLDEDAALDVLGALSVVDPKRAGRGAECLSGAVAG